MKSYFLKTKFSMSHSLTSIVSDILDLLRCLLIIFSSISSMTKKDFLQIKLMQLNFCRMEYIPRTAKKEAYCNRTDISFRKNLNSISAEVLNIEIPFCLTTISKVKWKIIGLIILMPFSCDSLDSPFLHMEMLIMSSNERFRQ